jgi:hypothetical protein
MNIEQDEASLFEEWKQHLTRGNLPFYPDGMAQSSSYWETRPRVLFLLKEVNADKSVPPWNLFDVVGDGSIGPTSASQAVQPPWGGSRPPVSDEVRHEILRHYRIR